MPGLDLEGPELPAAAQHLWFWFLELSASRRSAPHGLDPLGLADIAAWAQLTGSVLLPWEVAAIRALDVVFLKAFHAQLRQQIKPAGGRAPKTMTWRR